MVLEEGGELSEEADEVYVDLSQRDISALRNEYWRAGDLEWKLDGLQRKISEVVRSKESAKKILILSSRQIGKSFWAVGYTVEESIKRRIITRFLAPTRDNCHDIVNDNLTKIIDDAPTGLITKKKADMRWATSSGSSIRLGAMERAHVDKMGRGGNASLIIYEECGFVKGDDFTYAVNSVIGPQLLRSNGVEIFVTSPPVDPDHPLLTIVKPECEELGTFFSFTVFDSPTITMPQIVSAMRRSGCVLTEPFVTLVLGGFVNTTNVHKMAEGTGTVLSEAFRREYLAEIIRSATLMVVPPFNEKIHVQKFDNPTASKWTVTIDWGGVRDMTVALLHTYEYYSDTDLVVAEMVFKPNTLVNTIVDALRARFHSMFPIDAVWADVAGQTQVELIGLNYPITLPQKSDWLASIQAMCVRFSTNKILIDTSCTFLIKSLKSGMFNKNKTDFERNEAIGHCDALACLMYGVRMQNRENPYTNGQRPSNMVVTPKSKRDEGLLALSNAMSPKRFGSFK